MNMFLTIMPYTSESINSMSNEMKPTPSLSLFRYPNSFDLDMAYSLRERNPTTLEYVIQNSVSIEANLLIKKSKTKNEHKVTIKEEPSTTFDTKFDAFLRTIERMVNRMFISDRQT